MPLLPTDDSDTARVAALRLLGQLDSAPQAAFDALVKAASLVCDVPISLISLVDAQRQWFKANIGLQEVAQTSRDVAFCDHTIRSDALLEVPDARLDSRFANNPLVTGQPGIRFYAGMPLRLADGHRVGTLCVIDRQARRLSDQQRELLACLGQAASRLLDLQRPDPALAQATRALAEQAGEMSYRASHDPLTGLINRSEFEARLQRLLQTSRADRSRHALLYIDLDQFKLVNDACGHSAGDQLLQQVAQLLTDAVRHRDTLARLGGDEFAIILEHCTSDQAQRAAQLVCDRMESYRFLHDGQRLRVGASIGLVPVDARWATPAAILQAADTACYAAKEAGRNRVHTWHDTDPALRTRHGQMQWANRVELALDENRFVLYAQRISALCATAGQDHAEVLLRMVDADGSLVLPGAFLPAAERFNLVTRIDRWVLRRVLAWMHTTPDAQGLNMLSVNLSGQSIGDRAFHRWAIGQLQGAGPALCARLCLEVTETAAVTNLADAAVFITQVRALGVRVALDDFGAGASSFGYLKSLKVDFLKIDGQFIRDLIDDPLDEAAVRCFADVARLVGLQTVAEFVDNAPVLERLRGLGIDFVQGFLLHRPGPINELRQQARAVPA